MAPVLREPRTPSTRRRRRRDSSRRSPSVLGRPKARRDGAARRGVPVPASPSRRPRGVEDDSICRTRRCSRTPEGSTCRPRAARSSAPARAEAHERCRSPRSHPRPLPGSKGGEGRLQRRHATAGVQGNVERRRRVGSEQVRETRCRRRRRAILRFCDGREG